VKNTVLKILFTSYYFPPDFQGGAELSAYNIGKEFVEQGHEVHILTRASEAEYDEDLIVHNVLRESELPKEALSRQTEKEVKHLLQEHDFDIVHTQSEYTAIGAVKACKEEEVKCVVSIRDYWLLDPLRMCYDFKPGEFADSTKILDIIKRSERKFRFNGGKKHLLSPVIALYLERFRRYERKNIQHADCLITNSKYMEKKHQGLHPNIETIYNPIDTQLFASKKDKEDEKTKLFFVGRLRPEKGIITLLNALGKAVKKDNDIILDIVGTEQPPKWMNEKIEKNNIHENINFLGRVPFTEMPKHYNNSDIVIFPSEWQEPFGRISIEAMACQKPVITTQVGGIPEVVEDEETGLVIEPGNSRKLSEAMLELSEDRRKQETMGRKGRKRVEKLFSTEKIAEKQLKFYKKLI